MPPWPLSPFAPSLGEAAGALEWAAQVAAWDAEFTRQGCLLFAVLGKRASGPGGAALGSVTLVTISP
jgi:hypothetical protein